MTQDYRLQTHKTQGSRRDSMGRDFKNIKAWKYADDLAVLVYSASKSFPKSEMYGITSQLRRAAVSAKRESYPKNEPVLAFSQKGLTEFGKRPVQRAENQGCLEKACSLR